MPGDWKKTYVALKGKKKGNTQIVVTLSRTAKKKTKTKTLSCKVKVKAVNTVQDPSDEPTTDTPAETSRTVDTQEKLEAALKETSLQSVTLKSDASAKFAIPEGNYNMDLVVDAPNADVENRGVFKSINVKAIKEDTWREYAKGNRLVVDAIKARIIVQVNAAVERIQFLRTQAKVKLEVNGTVNAVDFSASQVNAQVMSSAGSSVGKVTVPAAADSTVVEMEVNGKVNDVDVQAPKSDVTVKVAKDGTLDKVGLQEQAESAKVSVVVDGKVGDVALGAGNANVSMEVNGTGNVSNVTVTKNITLNVSGKAEAPIPLKVSGNASITASTAVKVESNGDSKITLTKGAENSDVRVTNASAKVEVKSEVNVQVTKSDNTKVNVSSGGSTVIQPTTTGGNSSSGGSSSSGSSGSSWSGGSSGGSSSSGTTTGRQYDITVTNGENGTVTGAPEKSESGKTITMTIKANDGYVVRSVAAKAGETDVEVKQAEDGTYTFTMPASNVAVTVTYVKIYGITVKNDTTSGNVTGVPEKSESGKIITVTVKANDGYEVSGVTAKAGETAVDVKDAGNGAYTFTMPESDVAVTVAYVKKYSITKESGSENCTVTGTAKEGEEITVSGIGTVPVNQMAVVTVKDTSAAGKAVAVKDNGNDTYTFTMPASNVSVSVQYETVFTEGTYTGKAYKDTLKERASAFQAEFYNKQNGSINGEFGAEQGLDDKGTWWFDLIMSEPIQDKTVKSVTIDGEDIFNKNAIDISVGHDNHVKSKDCIKGENAIRLSYLFVMTHEVNEEGKLVFDVAFEGMSTVKAALDMGQLSEDLSCAEVVAGNSDKVTPTLSEDRKTCTVEFLDKELKWTDYKSLIGIELTNGNNADGSEVYYFTEKKYMKEGTQVSKGYGFTGQDTVSNKKVLGLYIPTPDKDWSYDSIQYKIITTDRKTLNTELLIQWNTKSDTSNEGGESQGTTQNSENN